MPAFKTNKQKAISVVSFSSACVHVALGALNTVSFSNRERDSRTSLAFVRQNSQIAFKNKNKMCFPSLPLLNRIL